MSKKEQSALQAEFTEQWIYSRASLSPISIIADLLQLGPYNIESTLKWTMGVREVYNLPVKSLFDLLLLSQVQN